MTEWVGKVLGKVRIERLIARGGMAEVYLGTHTTLDRQVAVKVMLSHLENEPELQARFQREARVLASLRHSNIVQIYDFDVAEGQPYIVMEYVRGISMASYLRSVHSAGGRLTLKEIGRILVMLASALDAAHLQGVIHRDVKPANVLLTDKVTTPKEDAPLPETVEAILSDFGLLRLVDSANQTASGVIAGTPSYMSPEQARGERVDSRSDIYSLGVVLYEMLAGRVPFEADTSMAVLMKHIQDPPPPIDGLLFGLQVVLDRALEKRPENRYETGREMARAFLEASNLSLVDVMPGYVSPSVASMGDRLPPVSRLHDQETLPFRKNLGSSEITDLPPQKKSPVNWAVVGGLAVVGVLAIGAFFSLSRPQAAPPTAMVENTATTAPATATSEPSATPLPDITETAVPATPTHVMEPAAVTNQTVIDGITTYGVLRFRNSPAFLNEATLNLENLPQPPGGNQYEVWLVGEEVRVSLGVLKLDEKGSASVDFFAPLGGNLLIRYHRMEITLEPVPDLSKNTSDYIVYSSGIPEKSLQHIRHLFVSFPDTPNQRALIIGLVEQTKMLGDRSRAMLQAYQSKNANGVSLHAEALYNLLVGKQDPNYGDLDKDGEITDPGDGYGLLLNGDNMGYISGTESHAKYAISMEGASANIILHGQHTMIACENMEGWAAEMRDLVTRVLADPLGEESGNLIRQIVSLSDRMDAGDDKNRDDHIEPAEGGAETALEHASYMVDMPILKGVNQLPPAVAAGEEITLPSNYGP